MKQSFEWNQVICLSISVADPSRKLIGSLSVVVDCDCVIIDQSVAGTILNYMEEW